MSQGKREHIVTFKNRFDKQVMANATVGIAAVSNSKWALDFLGNSTLGGTRSCSKQDMKQDALQRKAGAFPITLAVNSVTSIGTFLAVNTWISSKNFAVFLVDFYVFNCIRYFDLSRAIQKRDKNSIWSTPTRPGLQHART